MVWMLQVADEIDDAIGALRLCSLGLAADISFMVAATLDNSRTALGNRRQTTVAVKLPR